MLENMKRYPQQELATRLVSAMEEVDLSQAELARQCGVTIQAVHDWRATGRIGKQHLVTISRLTQKPLEYFLVGLGRAAAAMFCALPFIEALSGCVLCKVGERAFSHTPWCETQHALSFP